MYLEKINNLNKNIKIKYINNYLYIKGLYNINKYNMPRNFFFNILKKKIKLIFIKKFSFICFIKHIIYINMQNNFIYNIKIKIKGLGFRIRKISSKLYYFFFNVTNMYYLYIPRNILFKWYKKKLLLISNNFFLLKLLFSRILFLKNIGPYRLRGIRYPRQIIFIKKSSKKS